MTTSKPSSSNVTVKWAVIYLTTSIVITYIIQLLNLDPNSPVKYLGYIPFIAFLLLAQKEYRDNKLGGFISFGDAFMTGFLYAVFGGIMLAIFIYIYLTLLNPHAIEAAMESQRQAFVDKGLSSDQIDQSMELGKKYGAIFGAVGTLFVIPIFGAIVALIGAAIFKKEKSVADIENEANSFVDPTV